MYIEKNVFENIFNIVMDMKGKTKDNIKAILDIALFYNHQNMELVCDGSRVTKPRASFVLEKNAQLLVYKWLKSLRFPNGHASNISRLANMEECKLYGMKRYVMHSRRSVISLEIYAPTSWMLITLRGLKQISSRHYANLRWYSLHHFLTQWIISTYIYHSRQKLEDRSSVDGCTHSNG